MSSTETQRRDASVSAQKDALIAGASVLEAVLSGSGFQWEFRGEGIGSGGWFAWGDFICGDRTLELHFRSALGIVRYHAGDCGASHHIYMQELGVWDQCLYPGFSGDDASAFHRLAHDLGFADDFISGEAEVLRRAAGREGLDAAKHHQQLMVIYVGDAEKRAHMADSFRDGNFGDVVRLAAQLKYPEMMSESEQRLVSIANRNRRPA